MVVEQQNGVFYMDKNAGFDAEHIARNLIFDGRLTNEELAECCELPPERVHELIVESALILREQMLELREMLIAMRRPDTTEEERRRAVIDVVLQLKLIFEYTECEGVERNDIVSFLRDTDINSILRLLYQLNPYDANFEILHAGKIALNSIMATILKYQYMEG